MKQFIKELFFLMITVPLCLILVFFVMQKAEQSRQVEELKGTVEKKELTISSPVFGTIESFSLQEGQTIKKNQVIARIQIIDKKESLTLNSDIYSYDEKTGIVEVKSPTDAVLVKKELAEKSTIKPEENMMTLHPLTNTVIRIHADANTDVASFESVVVTDKNNTYSYTINLSKRLPVADKEGNVYYFATFNDQTQTKAFYNNQQVVVKARKQEKALTGKLEAAFQDISKNVIASVQGYIANL
jgi:hypothetical protein